MNNIYEMDEDSRTTPLRRLHCVDEDKELQKLLESNPELFLGVLIFASD